VSGILEALGNQIPLLSRKLAQAARFVVDHPETVALESMRGVARQSRVSAPTLQRLAQTLGYADYRALRAHLQQDLLGNGFGSRAQALSQAGDATLFARIAAAAHGNLDTALAENETATLKAMACLLRDARTAWVIAGSGVIHGFAAGFVNAGSLILPQLRLVPDSIALTMDALANIGPEDVMLAIGVSPCARLTTEAMDVAGARGTALLALTDRRSSPLAQRAALSLYAGTDSPHYYPSTIGLTLLGEALLATLAASGGQASLDRIRRIEALRKQSGAFIEQ
jgi:DNA-binding MurR/RpiR family transcriptional regulator